MSDPSYTKFVDSIGAKVPIWMTRSVGFRFLCSMIFLADVAVETLVEALWARFPGVGTPTALDLIGASRGMLRGMSDTDATFGARLLLWIDRWRAAGTALAVARAVQDYVADAPMIRVVNRAGVMLTLASDGTFAVDYASGWDWDSVSNPERNHFGFWSELWIIVYSPPWAISASDFTTWYWGTHELGLGMQIPRVDVDALRALVNTWKAAHTFIRTVVFTYDSSLFDPTSSPTMPDGNWGQYYVGGVPSSRSSSCRFFEPEADPNNYFALRG